MLLKCNQCGKENEVIGNLFVENGTAVVKCKTCGFLIAVDAAVSVKNAKPVAASPPKSTPVAENTSIVNKKAGPQLPDVPGWVVLYRENAEPRYFPLKLGKNMIGRKATSNTDVAVRIETEDLFMGRQHCFIEVIFNQKLNKFDFLISDNNSANGTFLNGKVQKKLDKQDVYHLEEGGSFTAGKTRIFLKTNNSKIVAAENAGDDREGNHTVLVRKK